MEFMYLLIYSNARWQFSRQFRCLSLCLCEVFRTLSNSLCWVLKGKSERMVISQSMSAGKTFSLLSNLSRPWFWTGRTLTKHHISTRVPLKWQTHLNGLELSSPAFYLFIKYPPWQTDPTVDTARTDDSPDVVFGLAAQTDQAGFIPTCCIRKEGTVEKDEACKTEEEDENVVEEEREEEGEEEKDSQSCRSYIKARRGRKRRKEDWEKQT